MTKLLPDFHLRPCRPTKLPSIGRLRILSPVSTPALADDKAAARQIFDAVAAAKILNTSLVIPYLEVNPVWHDSSGSLEFVVPTADPSSFFPISAHFSSSKTFSDLKVTNILPLKGGATPKFSQRTQLVTENYQVV
nr:coatomer subunit delta-like isoform X1 [Ipomoea batatas]